MKRIWLAALAVSGAISLTAHVDAYEVRCRFVERIGNADVVIFGGGELIYFPRRFRLQVGVFDDAQSPAPAGGVLGWRGDQNNLDLLGRRTPGRLPNFSFPAGGNGLPESDPYIALTQIDAERGPQTIVWDCADGVPLPMPQPVIRGRNTFVSVWETTVRGGHCFQQYLEFSGVVVVAQSWVVAGDPSAPVCNPPSPGSVAYVPVGIETGAVTCSLFFDGGPPPWPVPPYFFCTTDWHRDLRLDSRDFFDFLTDFFSGFADVNCDNVTDAEDVFYFIREFLGDCRV